jgi:3-oxoadipyl-CoA thiolase
MNSAYIVDGVRTAIGNIGGGLSEVRADDLAARTIAELLRRNPSLDPTRITNVMLGCANQAGDDNRNVARMSLLLAGLPVTVPGETVNRLCASGMSAVAHAARAVMVGDGDFYVAGGVENMTRAPYVMSKASKPFARDIELFDTSLGWRFVNPAMKAKYGVDSMGQTAENVAEQFSVTRKDQDLFAVRSQMKAAASRAAGRFEREIVAVDIPQKKGDPKRFDVDEFIRPDTTPETLAKLKPVFRPDGGSVTAGNSSGLNDGAAALLITSEKGAKDIGATPLARIVATAVAGVEPRIMGMGPVPSSRLVLGRAGLTLKEMDVIELNEAFAAQFLAVQRELDLPLDRTNPNGSGISLGHPIGATGAILTVKALHELRRIGGRYALVSMCIGGGQGIAAIFESVN